MNSNPDILTNVFGYDEKDVEFERVVNNLDDFDIDYGVDVIFDYYRRHGFPHYTIREEEKHDHMRKLQKFDIDTILDGDKIVQTMHGLRMAWTYFPHFGKFDVEVLNNHLWRYFMTMKSSRER